MKAGLIKLTNEDDIFYDSKDRLYRCRMHCPYCGKYSGCRCFDTLKKAEDFIEDSAKVICSSKCFLESFSSKLKDAYKVIDEMGLDFDSVEGEAC